MFFFFFSLSLVRNSLPFGACCPSKLFSKDFEGSPWKRTPYSCWWVSSKNNKEKKSISQRSNNLKSAIGNGDQTPTTSSSAGSSSPCFFFVNCKENHQKGKDYSSQANPQNPWERRKSLHKKKARNSKKGDLGSAKILAIEASVIAIGAALDYENPESGGVQFSLVLIFA